MKGGRREGAGRHPVGDVARSVVRKVFLTVDEAGRLQELSAAEGISPSEWMAQRSGLRGKIEKD